MATFDLTEYLEDDGIELTGIPSEAHPEGGSYRFPSPSFEVGLWLRNLIEFGQRATLGVDTDTEDLAKQVGNLVLDDDEEMDLYRRVMGDTFDQLREDGVSWGRVGKIFTVLLRKWGMNMPIEATLREDAEGNSAAPANRADRRASEKPAKKAPARSSSPKAGSRSNPTSGATKARMGGRGSTRSNATSGASPAVAV